MRAEVTRPGKWWRSWVCALTRHVWWATGHPRVASCAVCDAEGLWP